MRNTFATLMVVLAAAVGHGADVPKAPVPPSPYLPVVYRYADAMIERGRDTNGLFLSALDRRSLAPLTNRPPAPRGIAEENRVSPPGTPLVGSNPYHDENLLRLLHTLSELSGKPKYRAAAEAELKWLVRQGKQTHVRPWMLWDRCFEAAPEESRKFVDAIASATNATPREIGFDVRSWAVAFAQTRDERFLRRIERALAPFDRIDLASGSGPAILSLAIDCDGAAHRVPEPLAARLRAVAARADESYRTRDSFASLWSARHGPTTAQLGMMCVSRYDNTGDVGYRARVHAAADAYLNSLPPENDDVWAVTLGQAISLQVAAWRSMAQPQYLARARTLADFAVAKFFDGSPLPRASLKTEHYETVAGADTLALALIELHLHILHITAVRCPPNTIDR